MVCGSRFTIHHTPNVLTVQSSYVQRQSPGATITESSRVLPAVVERYITYLLRTSYLHALVKDRLAETGRSESQEQLLTAFYCSV